MVIEYYNSDTLCSKIYVDEDHKEVRVENFTDKLVFRAFGINEHPTWKDYEEFLEDRCFPRNRHHVEYNLKCLGLTEYNPLEICKRTEGRMYGDFQWMKFMEG